MNNEFTRVLSLKSEKALNFFLKTNQYKNIELPVYFSFDPILNYVKEKIGDKVYKDCLKEGAQPEQLDRLNYDLLLNKDGHYATRPVMMANPYLYYFLSRELCREENWAALQELFKKLRTPHIKVCSMPVVPKPNEKFYQSTTILNWWQQMEQQSIELSLEYRYMFITDITDCYGSIRLHSFDEAFALQGTKFEKTASPLAATIRELLHVMNHGRNVGIPQGSALFDFLSEIILGYADLMLHEAVEQADITAKFKVLRYRDDYRIFCNDRQQLEQISFLLQEVLAKLNFNINSKKTKLSESIVTDAIKPDKLDLIYDLPLLRGQKYGDFHSYEKALYFILLFARKHPNSGQARKLLTDLNNSLTEYIKEQKKRNAEYEELTKSDLFDFDTETEDAKAVEATDDTKAQTAATDSPKTEIKAQIKKKEEPQVAEAIRIPGGSIRAMVAIATQIALENVSIAQYTLPLMKQLINCLGDKQLEEQCKLYSLVYEKLHTLHNADYLLIWLQNLTYTLDAATGNTTRYESPLCKLVMNEMSDPVWDCSWLLPELSEELPYDKIVNRKVLKAMTKVVHITQPNQYDEADEPVLSEEVIRRLSEEDNATDPIEDWHMHALRACEEIDPIEEILDKCTQEDSCKDCRSALPENIFNMLKKYDK